MGQDLPIRLVADQPSGFRLFSRVGNQTEVLPPVVRSNAVAVVDDEVPWVLSSHPFPDESVRSDGALPNADPQVTRWFVQAGGDVSRQVIPSATLSPGCIHSSFDFSRLWVVIKQQLQGCVRRQRQWFLHSSNSWLELFRQNKTLSRTGFRSQTTTNKTEVFI